VDAHEFLARHRQQPEGIVLAQVGLDREGQAAQVLQARDVLRVSHAGGVQALARDWHRAQQAVHERAQALELQRVQALARYGLDLRGDGCVHPSCARGWRSGQG
jgi:CubicO group peptidase (beta-lactamase class C family)